MKCWKVVETCLHRIQTTSCNTTSFLIHSCIFWATNLSHITSKYLVERSRLLRIIINCFRDLLWDQIGLLKRLHQVPEQIRRVVKSELSFKWKVDADFCSFPQLKNSWASSCLPWVKCLQINFNFSYILMGFMVLALVVPLNVAPMMQIVQEENPLEAQAFSWPPYLK